MKKFFLDIYLWCSTQYTTYWCTRIRIINKPKNSLPFLSLSCLEWVFIMIENAHHAKSPIGMRVCVRIYFLEEIEKKSYWTLLQKRSCFDKTFVFFFFWSSYIPIASCYWKAFPLNWLIKVFATTDETNCLGEIALNELEFSWHF